jgi:hypothetical protein
MAYYAPSFPFGHFITDRRLPFPFSLSLGLSQAPTVALYGGRAVANKTVDEVSRPISGKAGRLFPVCE